MEGPQGWTGPQGEVGSTGRMGATGERGLKGDMGLRGEVGSTGRQGRTGATGLSAVVLSLKLDDLPDGVSAVADLPDQRHHRAVKGNDISNALSLQDARTLAKKIFI